MLDELPVIIGVVGVPAIVAVLFRAAVNKLDERFMTKQAFTELRAAVDREMAEVRTSHQSLMAKIEDVGKKVETVITEDRYRVRKMDDMESELKQMSGTLADMRVHQVEGFSAVREDLRAYVEGALDKIEKMVHRKL